MGIYGYHDGIRGHHLIVSGPRVVEWVSGKLAATYNRPTGIGIEKNGELIAGVVFDEYNRANVNISVASDGSRRWLNRSFLWAVFDYAFKVCKVRRVTALIASDNHQSINFCRAVGFSHEATLKDAHVNGDILIYRMFRDECKWR